MKNTFFEESGCMMWKGDRYERVPCDTMVNTVAGNKVIPVNKELLEYQRKIVATDTTTFFNPAGYPCVWYRKLSEDECEFFSYHGKHPETGRQLKEITPYIIIKYVKKRVQPTP